MRGSEVVLMRGRWLAGAAALVIALIVLIALIVGADAPAARPPWHTALALCHQACDWLVAWRHAEPLSAMLIFALSFATLSALAIPGCSVLALAAGAMFGLAWGTALITLSSALGATASFLVARHWLRERVRQRWQRWLAQVEAFVHRDGALGLFTLRMAPVIPFPVLNPLMGLTSMTTWTFFWVSALGMAAGSAAYAAVGAGLWALSPGSGMAPSPTLALALTLLALLPWTLRWAWRKVRA